MTTPIADFVARYARAGVSRLHMPGHKGQPFLGCEALDITEIAGADELYEAEGIIAESEANASDYVRLMELDAERAGLEERLDALLSDVKPNDVIQISQSGRFVDYAGDNGIQNTAMEIRALTYRGISVMCVFTGNDDDLPAAHTVYGRNFARIRSLDQFADTVGALIQNQIRSL